MSFALGLSSIALLVIGLAAEGIKGRVEQDYIFSQPGGGGALWNGIDVLLTWIAAGFLVAPLPAVGAVAAGHLAGPKKRRSLGSKRDYARIGLVIGYTIVALTGIVLTLGLLIQYFYRSCGNC